MASKQRQSGIELLKIAAIFLIVVSHVTQSLGRDVSSLGVPNDYLVDLAHSTTDITTLILGLFRHFGALGNAIFFVCSAWFLCDSKKTNTPKIVKLLADIFVVSILMLGGFLLSGIQLSKTHILLSLLPTTFANNWYMTTYILFYAVHTGLNAAIEKMSQRSLLKTALIMTVLYGGFGMVKADLFYGNYLIYFIAIYFVICYMKKYMPQFCESAKANRILLAIGAAGMLLLYLGTDFAGLRIHALSEMLLRWNRNNNPFLIMIAIALLNLARMKKFVNPAINYISGLSFLIYIIHENLLVSGYLRPRIWRALYQQIGHSLLILQVFVFSVVLFAAAILISILYQKTVMKLTGAVCDKLYGWLHNGFSALFSKIEQKDSKNGEN